MGKQGLVWLLSAVLLLAVAGGVYWQWTASTDITGHWHVTAVGPNAEAGTYSLLDVYGGGTACFDCDERAGSWGSHGSHRTWQRSLLLGGECRILDLTYRLVNDALYLYQSAYPSDGGQPAFVAVRREPALCDVPSEHFRHGRIAVQLPKSQERLRAIEDIPAFLRAEVHIGSPRDTTIYTLKVPHVGLRDIVHPLDGRIEYARWWQQHLVKLPEGKRERAYAVIFADKGVDESTVRLVAGELRDTGVTMVYRGYTFRYGGVESIGMKVVE